MKNRKLLFLCICCFFPLAAILHHLVFYRPTCMLNPFGPDYTLSVIKFWFLKDSSVGWAAFLVTVSYFLAKRYKLIKLGIISFLPSFNNMDMGIFLSLEGSFVITFTMES